MPKFLSMLSFQKQKNFLLLGSLILEMGKSCLGVIEMLYLALNSQMLRWVTLRGEN